MIIKLYRKLPDTFRKRVYDLFLGDLLFAYRHPQLIWQNVLLKRKLSPFLQQYKGKEGIEIGGPSKMFARGGLFPIYSCAARIDGCNFSDHTIYEGHIDRSNYKYKKKILGQQYIGEASEVAEFVDGRYNFLITSNCLEHVANPLKAIESWIKLLREDGLLFVCVPNKIKNFDRLRPDTPFDHFEEDYKNGVNETDSTHLREYIDCAVDKINLGFSKEEIIRMLNHNFNYRCLHHHVYNKESLRKSLEYFSLKIVFLAETEQDIYIIGKK